MVPTGSLYDLAWEATAHASSYQLAKDGTTPTQTGLAGTFKRETAPSREGTLIWRLRACGAGGCSAWSAPVAINLVATKPPCTQPPCINPRIIGPPIGGGGDSPNGSGGTGALALETTYNDQGYPETLSRMSDGYPYLTVQTMDAFGHATIVTEGNGVTVTRGYDQVTGLALSTDALNPHTNETVAHLTTTWDGFGNLASRTAEGSTEIATYDALNRLHTTTSTLADGTGGFARSWQYDATGNRTEACEDNGTINECITYHYGENGAGPHAVTSSSDGGRYTYNRAGEMLNDNGKALEWSAFGKATSITHGSTHVTIAYGPGGTRYRKTVSGATSETVTYLGAAERLTVNGQTSIRRALSFAGLAVIDTGGADAKLLYPIPDHLGSVMAMSDAAGALLVQQQMSYSPFGQRMTVAWSAYMSMSQALAINTTDTDKGYTGQEELDAVGLVNYNARLYDPKLGRFLSVDPLIAHPGSTQAINPYSYVENNPLNKTDPTGMASLLGGGMGGGMDCDMTYCHIPTPPPDSGSHHTPGPPATGSHIPGTQSKVGNITCTSMDCASGYATYSVTATVAKNPSGGQGTKPASTKFDENTHSKKGGDSGGAAWGSSLYGTGGFWGAVKCFFTCDSGDPVESLAAVPLIGPEARVGGALIEEGVTTGLKAAVRLGKIGERAVGDIGKKARVFINGRWRIPDGITRTTLSEVKNVRRQSFTRQLRDYLDYAQKENLRFDLYLRSDTKVSGPLQQQIDRSLINRVDIPPW